LDLERICAAAFETQQAKHGTGAPVTKNARQIADYIKLMSYSGTRRNEALGVKWTDVDFDNGQLHVKRQITSRGIEDLKNRNARVVDFNPKLKTHLLEMQRRSRGVSEWLFPSPQRGEKDIPAKSFRESLALVRTHANMSDFNFHDCRHYFVSMCVMSGIDFMTIAEWVGHQDGGVLIGKVYGHLAASHKKEQAQRVNFGPTVVQHAASY
jgi:integrase